MTDGERIEWAKNFIRTKAMEQDGGSQESLRRMNTQTVKEEYTYIRAEALLEGYCIGLRMAAISRLKPGGEI